MLIRAMAGSFHLLLLGLHVLLLPSEPSASDAPVLYACDSQVFCQGDLLQTVQMAKLFNDSKTFVDMRMVHDANKTREAFKALGDKPTREQIKGFVEGFFQPPGHDLENWEPEDWKENPGFIDKINDSDLKTFGRILNSLWKKLGRNISAEARENINRSSLIVVDKPFIVPGGRFREFYYWDTYWTVKGLLVCEMSNTVRNMIDNFVQLVREIGFIPNGGRIYYKNRSQPPFLIPIVDLYLDYTKDFDYVKSILGDLEAEYDFWQKSRQVKVSKGGETWTLNRYLANMNTPRPESYYEDVHTAQSLPVSRKPPLFQDLASAAESGWDFSSRWFGKNSTDLKGTMTQSKVPVDLNAVLYRNEKTLERLFTKAGNLVKAEKYKELAKKRAHAMEMVFWNEGKGSWLDFDLNSNSSNPDFHASTFAPMWAGLHQGNVTRDLLLMTTLRDKLVLSHQGGIPTTLKKTGQQWDYPNAWPPLQDIAIDAMADSKSEEVKRSAFILAQKWVNTNYKAWKATGHMFEKFNADIQGAPGGGGEYDIQVGFGWSNGVALQILQTYGAELSVRPGKPSTASCPGHAITWSLIMLSCLKMLLN
ncbi:trehalase-like [Nematostella vectensis]|uniref:trehalase-like n=1 Tax=Nematostella vectensis TaxID=45351 RepID=UPI002077809C|nr:trehalase-like [Nematostella vectensis]